MTYKHYNSAVERIPVGIETAAERALFLDACYLADYKGVLRMSQVELSQQTLWSLATVKRLFIRLEEEGLLVKIAHGRYQVNMAVKTDNAKAPAETTSLSHELVKWIKSNFDEETAGYIFEDKEISITETQEDIAVVQKAVTSGLLVELRKEEGVYEDEPTTIYQLTI